VHAVVPAEVRLARILLHWSHRMAISGQSVRQLKLAMSRRDIARLLGVAHETVSRSFGSLAASGCVAVTGRTVDILDAAALQAAARSPIALQPPAKRDAESARPHHVPALP
jgi:CRP/FNR family transcriptional regulator